MNNNISKEMKRGKFFIILCFLEFIIAFPIFFKSIFLFKENKFLAILGLILSIFIFLITIPHLSIKHFNKKAKNMIIVEKDERIKNIRLKSGNLAFWSLYCLLTIIFILSFFIKINIQLLILFLLVFSFAVYVLSIIFFNKY